MLYEYKIVSDFHHLEITEDSLNLLGQEGWKLAGIFPAGPSAAKLIFVRQTFYSEIPWQMKIWTGDTPAINIDIGRGGEG